MEREALKQKHQNEIAAFHHQQQLIQQLKMKSSKFQALQQIPSSPTVSAPAATTMYPITYQSVTPTYTGNSGLFVPLKQCICAQWLVDTKIILQKSAWCERVIFVTRGKEVCVSYVRPESYVKEGLETGNCL